jgi:hypothetical protein
MADYPWWKSRKEIQKFLETTSGWGLGLPVALTAKQLQRLYMRHRPKEFIAFELLSDLFDHGNCPKSILEDGLRICLKLRRSVDSCLNALALRSELSVGELAEVANDFLGEDISDHALFALVRKRVTAQDRRCLVELRKIDALLPRSKKRDLHLKRWLRSHFVPKKQKRKSVRAGTSSAP